MDVSAFDFVLPDENIALRPVVPRDASRLLCVTPGQQPCLTHASVQDLPELLSPGDMLVFNNTRVIPSRLHGLRARGEARAKVEIMLHLRQSPNMWVAFARPAKKLNLGEIVHFGSGNGNLCYMASFTAEVMAKGEGGEVSLRFDLSGPALDEAIALHGELPLPPYIAGKRATDEQDAQDYQTIYAREEGAVAAPTAGLHFTDELFARLGANGISSAFVTLHVGAGTFLPVKAENTDDHRMHAEWGHVSADVAARLNAARASGGRVVAIGTTSLRLLESATDQAGLVQPWSGETDIFITPGYRFRAVDMMLTNFHLPRSTLFMLVSAFCGLETMQGAYAEAIARGYRFYSYGDASLLSCAASASMRR